MKIGERWFKICFSVWIINIFMFFTEWTMLNLPVSSPGILHVYKYAYMYSHKHWSKDYKAITWTPSATSILSVCKFSLHYPHKISFLVMRIKQMNTHRKLSKMKNKTLSTCLHLQGTYTHLGAFSKRLHIHVCGLFGAEWVKHLEYPDFFLSATTVTRIT